MSQNTETRKELDDKRDWTKATPEELKVWQGMKVTYEVEITRGGQPRPYADHEHGGYLTISRPEGQLWGRSRRYTEEEIKPIVRVLFGNWSEEPLMNSMDSFYAPRLAELKEVEPNKWFVLIKTPFID